MVIDKIFFFLFLTLSTLAPFRVFAKLISFIFFQRALSSFHAKELSEFT